MSGSPVAGVRFIPNKTKAKALSLMERQNCASGWLVKVRFHGRILRLGTLHLQLQGRPTVATPGSTALFNLVFGAANLQLLQLTARLGNSCGLKF